MDYSSSPHSRDIEFTLRVRILVHSISRQHFYVQNYIILRIGTSKMCVFSRIFSYRISSPLTRPPPIPTLIPQNRPVYSAQLFKYFNVCLKKSTTKWFVSR